MEHNRSFKYSNLIKALGIYFFGFVSALLPLIIMMVISYFSKVSYSNLELYSNILQIVIVESSISFSMEQFENGFEWMRYLYAVLFIGSLVLFVLCQTKVEIEKELVMFIVSAVMLFIVFVINVVRIVIKNW